MGTLRDVGLQCQTIALGRHTVSSALYSQCSHYTGLSRESQIYTPQGEQLVILHFPSVDVVSSYRLMSSGNTYLPPLLCFLQLLLNDFLGDGPFFGRRLRPWDTISGSRFEDHLVGKTARLLLCSFWKVSRKKYTLDTAVTNHSALTQVDVALPLLRSQAVCMVADGHGWNQATLKYKVVSCLLPDWTENGRLDLFLWFKIVFNCFFNFHPV